MNTEFVRYKQTSVEYIKITTNTAMYVYMSRPKFTNIRVREK